MSTSPPLGQLPSQTRRRRILRSLWPCALRLLSHLPTHQLGNSSQRNDQSGKVIIGARTPQGRDLEILDRLERHVGPEEEERSREEGCCREWHCTPNCWSVNSAWTAAISHAVKHRRHIRKRIGKGKQLASAHTPLMQMMFINHSVYLNFVVTHPVTCFPYTFLIMAKH